jgi:hypothetical protein
MFRSANFKSSDIRVWRVVRSNLGSKALGGVVGRSIDAGVCGMAKWWVTTVLTRGTSCAGRRGEVEHGG